MAQRVTLARVDNVQWRTRVSAARRLIYEKNLQVNSTAVESLLRETSLVPTVACNKQICIPVKNGAHMMLIF